MRLLAYGSLLSLFLLSSLPQLALASVLAIDYGSDFIKASLMKPGVPFDVLLNKDSKRKINSVTTFKKGERLYGADGFNLRTRFPSDTFTSLKYLQAAPYDSPVVQYHKRISLLDSIQTDRNTVAFSQTRASSDDEELDEWTVEELTAMQLAYIKHLAELTANEKVTDVIITVPAYFSQFERDAIVDAIEISGLKTLALINDGTAVAVNYAMTRAFNEKPEYHVIYDAGASGVRATVAAFTTATEKKGTEPVTQITVMGVGYDRSVGGTEFDRRLREILIEAFNSKYSNKGDIRGNKKGMAKLWKEAQRVKTILSANIETNAGVESVAWDLDFKTKVTRKEFELKCRDMKAKFATPIEDAVRMAGLTLDDISTVILTGGSSRVPLVQSALKSLVGASKVASNVNADEAAVLGAALHGASLSRQFKTKAIKLTDISPFDIQATYWAAKGKDNERVRAITTTIFASGSKVGTKKVLTFKRKEDFSIYLDYKDEPAPGFPTRMLEVELGGVSEAIANLTERGATDPVVKATVLLSESGFVSVTDAVVFGEIKEDSVVGKIKGLFGGSNSEEETEQAAENVPPRDTETASSSATPSESPATNDTDKKEKKKDKKEKAPTPVENTIPLTVNALFPTIPPLSLEAKKASRSRLRALDNEEAAKTRREEARNTFEGYLYRLRDLLDDSNNDTPFKMCSQDRERRAILEKLEESFMWLNDRGDLAETSQFLDKRIALETLEKPIIHRYQEIEAFPQALNNSQMWNWSTRLFLTEARQNLTTEAAADLPSKWTKDELDSLEKSLKEHEKWLAEWVEKQKNVKPSEDPVIETTEMKARAKVLEGQLQRLWKRKIPKSKPKPKVTPTSTKEPEPEATESINDKDAPHEGEADDGKPDDELPYGSGEDGHQVPLRPDDEL
ncbi:Hsp70 protein-domain-containing protein [Crepidotus variabilis]|uniref:Hsp70 protein-domain-containing protein n=1 Tax=Crepidotus variabilis TaxID=179855 RepID=A0A9P6EFS6_9AGAR|nr:Hsp70 protein-domain-containing protein [Crepidotus variabilis]